jgi:hypothetical protein
MGWVGGTKHFAGDRLFQAFLRLVIVNVTSHCGSAGIILVLHCVRKGRWVGLGDGVSFSRCPPSPVCC